MRPAWAVSVLTSGVAAAGCPAPSLLDVDMAPTTSASEGAPTTTEAAPGEPAASEGVVTTTEAPPTSTDPFEETGAVTSGPPAQPPSVEEVLFDPEPLALPGPIAVTVSTAFATGVRMTLDKQPEDGEGEPLAPAGADLFSGEIVVQSYLANGTHEAHFVPTNGERDGTTVTRTFAVALPEGGQEIYWEAMSDLGQGEVAALAVLPDGKVVEFGTLAGSQCYVRRRAPSGSWSLDTDVRLLPMTPCVALDAGVAEDGSVYVLADRKGQGDLSWWLGRLATFEGGIENVRFGSPKEEAFALALEPGRAAVCGTQPTGLQDKGDMAVWLLPFQKEGSTKTFDYVPPQGKVHQIRETPRDCVFAGDSLVLVGEAYGKHDPWVQNIPALDRLFLFEYGINEQTAHWTVDGDPQDTVTQSHGHALAIDSDGWYFVAGSTCGNPCVETVGNLRRYAPGGASDWSLELASQLVPPRGLAWHPGGYVVLTSAVKDGWISDYFVQAWQPKKYPALWSYDKSVLPTVHMATAIVIGPYGQVYTGGVGSDGYPAVAFIYG